MPFLATKIEFIADSYVLGVHIIDSLHQETLLIKAYFQDMVRHHIVEIVRVNVVPPATSMASSFSSGIEGLRPCFFSLSFFF
jgi:hypothetical protein